MASIDMFSVNLYAEIGAYIEALLMDNFMYKQGVVQQYQLPRLYERCNRKLQVTSWYEAKRKPKFWLNLATV